VTALAHEHRDVRPAQGQRINFLPLAQLQKFRQPTDVGVQGSRRAPEVLPRLQPRDGMLVGPLVPWAWLCLGGPWRSVQRHDRGQLRRGRRIKGEKGQYAYGAPPYGWQAHKKELTEEEME
jgi:hypothetical protein